jgi:hypothetical protein
VDFDRNFWASKVTKIFPFHSPNWFVNLRLFTFRWKVHSTFQQIRLLQDAIVINAIPLVFPLLRHQGVATTRWTRITTIGMLDEIMTELNWVTIIPGHGRTKGETVVMHPLLKYRPTVYWPREDRFFRHYGL